MPGEPAEIEPNDELAIKAWNMMGGLDWAALETVSDVFGITDIESLIARLTAIRDFQNDN